MAIHTIDAGAIYSNSVERLANRPTAASRFGQGGLTPEQLKAAYDKLPKMAIEKINELIDIINAEASPEAIAGIIKTPIPTGEADGEYKTLYEVLVDILEGDLAGYLKLNGLWGEDLQAELEALEGEIGTKDALPDEQGNIYARIAAAMVMIASLGSSIDDLLQKQWGEGNIGDGAITAPKLADGAVTTGKMGDGAVTSEKLGAQAVTGEKLAPSSVDTAALSGGAVTEDKLSAALTSKMNSAFGAVAYNSANGVLTFTNAAGAAVEIDLPLEMLISDGFYAYPYSDAILIPGPTYAVGKYVTYNGALYRCISPTSGEFDASAWELVSEQAESDNELVLELASGNVIEIPTRVIAQVVIDATLKNPGQAADAAIVGTQLGGILSRLDELEYVAIAINSFSNTAGTVEMGSTVSDIVLNWSLNKTPISQTVEGVNIGGSIGSIANIDPAARSLALGDTLTSNRTYTLIVSDGKTTVRKSTSVTFLNGVYYGAAVPAAYDSAFVLALNKKLASSRGGSVNVSAAAGQYIYYAYPVRFGAASFVIGGFSGGFELVATIAFTNASGYTEDYYIYKSEQAGLGALKVEVS